MSVAPHPTLMFVPSGALPIACTSAPQRSNALGARPEYVQAARELAHTLASEGIGLVYGNAAAMEL